MNQFLRHVNSMGFWGFCIKLLIPGRRACSISKAIPLKSRSIQQYLFCQSTGYNNNQIKFSITTDALCASFLKPNQLYDEKKIIELY